MNRYEQTYENMCLDVIRGVVNTNNTSYTLRLETASVGEHLHLVVISLMLVFLASLSRLTLVILVFKIF